MILLPLTLRPDITLTNNLGQNCMCPCTSIGTKWDYLDGLNLTREQLVLHLSNYLLELAQTITTDVKKTSAYLKQEKCCFRSGVFNCSRLFRQCNDYYSNHFNNTCRLCSITWYHQQECSQVFNQIFPWVEKPPQEELNK